MGFQKSGQRGLMQPVIRLFLEKAIYKIRHGLQNCSGSTDIDKGNHPGFLS
ncbi:hypothetical protein IAE55_21015 [Paenibacillus sp. S28]|nr:hypothetical protein [Paenibacillus sp. S28]